jgi:hypothetical protein
MLFVVNCLFFLFSALCATRRIVSARAPHGAIAMKIGKCGGFDNKKISVIAALQLIECVAIVNQDFLNVNLGGRRTGFWTYSW